MALTTKNQLLIAYKKLVGKTHTNAQFGDVNESIGSNIQLDSKTIIADVIPSVASNTPYSITSGTVEKIEFDLVSIPSSQYTSVGTSGGGITADGDGAPTLGTFNNGIHAFKLRLPADYVASSSNPKKNTGFFLNSQVLSDTGGKLQIIPQRYGNSYKVQVSSSTGIISELSQEDYHLDTFSGILFLQDINRLPTKVSAHLYIGDFLDQNESSINAPESSILFASGSQATGSSLLNYNSSTNVLSGTISQFINITASDILIYGTANLSNNPLELAYVTYDSSIDKIQIFPGLNISGSTNISGNLSVTGTISASNYEGLPGLPKLIVSSSVSLLADQRAVFAKNSDSSSFSITLPSASLADSKEYYVIKTDSVSGSVIVLPSSPNLINGASSFELNGPYQSITLIHDGTDWYVF